MATHRPPKPDAASFLPADRATAPMPIEEESASAWQRFEELQRAQEQPFPPTQPATGPAPSSARAYAATEPMGIAAHKAPAAAQPGQAVTLDEVMVVARRNNRACPVPAAWAQLHRLLPARALQGGANQAAPAPVDGAAWHATSAMQKRLRLRDQIEWAEREHVLPAVHAFLAALPEEQWHHFGD